MAARTATDTWAVRTITGTVNELTVTNGDGVSGNPTLSIPAGLTFTGKTITGGTFASPTLSGTVAGAVTWSGSLQTFQGNLLVQKANPEIYCSASSGTPKFRLETAGRYDEWQNSASGMDFVYNTTGTPKTMRWNGTSLALDSVNVMTVAGGTFTAAITAPQVNLNGSNGILRHTESGGDLYYDAGAGGASAAGHVWRSSNSFNTLMRLFSTGGLNIGSPTGGDKGAGTLNCVAAYDDNSLLTCYIVEAWKYGDIDLNKWDDLVPNREHPAQYETVETGETDDDGKPITEQRVATEAWTETRRHEPARGFAKVAADRLDIDKFAKFVWDNERLPAFPAPDRWRDMYAGNLSAGDLIQRLWETVEVMAVHSIEARKRELALLARVEALEAAQ